MTTSSTPCQGRVLGPHRGLLDRHLDEVRSLGEGLESVAARRGQVAGCIVHSDRGAQFRSPNFVSVLARHSTIGSMGEPVPQATTRPWRAFSRCCGKRPRPPCAHQLRRTLEPHGCPPWWHGRLRGHGLDLRSPRPSRSNRRLWPGSSPACPAPSRPRGPGSAGAPKRRPVRTPPAPGQNGSSSPSVSSPSASIA